jgi:hypothetical protein
LPAADGGLAERISGLGRLAVRLELAVPAGPLALMPGPAPGKVAGADAADGRLARKP